MGDDVSVRSSSVLEMNFIVYEKCTPRSIRAVTNALVQLSSAGCEPASNAACGTGKRELRGNPPKPLILVVEDDVMLQELSAEILRDCGYCVLIAEDAASAIEILRCEPDIKLIFTDVVMPGALNGFDLADQAKALRPEINVLYTSGYSWAASGAYSGKLHGALLAKPFRPAQLVAAVDDALHSHRN
jgi:CheY-like chemotaxis protein